MATSTIKNPNAVTNTKATANSTYINSENNELYLFKTGHTVYLSGWINNTVECPAYQTIFTLPDGYKPIHPMSITPINLTNNLWLFAGYDGAFSAQSGAIPTGPKYFSISYISSQNI